MIRIQNGVDVFTCLECGIEQFVESRAMGFGSLPDRGLISGRVEKYLMRPRGGVVHLLQAFTVLWWQCCPCDFMDARSVRLVNRSAVLANGAMHHGEAAFR